MILGVLWTFYIAYTSIWKVSNLMSSLLQFFRGLKYYFANHWVANFPSFRLRHWFYRQIMHYSLGKDSSIHMRVFVTGPHIHIGDNVVVNRCVYLDGRIGVRIQDNVSISPEVYIVSLEHDPYDPTFATRGAEVVIEEDVWIGVRAMIMPGVRVGKGAVVAAGAVVTKDVAPYQIVAGVPARSIGERSHKLSYKLRYFPWFDTDIQR